MVEEAVERRKRRKNDCYCLVDAIKLLDKDVPEVEKALARLFELTPIGGSKLVKPPDFAVDIGNGKL